MDVNLVLKVIFPALDLSLHLLALPKEPIGHVRELGFTALGGEGDFPMTIIVNKEGVITFTCRGSITHDELVAAVEEALGK